ncbi:MAG TPA: hypothetical protein DGG95_03245 [Cytophagales bacterium]|nr:hypothetical protein [Cytophagales bacterium]
MLWDNKKIGHEGWEKWCFSRGVLRFGRKQWRPENILHDRELVNSLEISTDRIIKKLSTNYVDKSEIDPPEIK